MPFDANILKQAGITPGVAAKLIGVSRVTASQWYNGHVQPHRLLESRVANFMRTVQAALDQKLLPLPAPPGRKYLLDAIAQALVTANRSQTS